ncbi:sporulation integral membrane protein YtvI [Aminipila butyrica]|uniref:Sporulation integral membrane protein YtvI n=1 Tax=Aminipila butyrica TaxID=433296 RepID=A0A858BYS4_9FIRM|nr:sporulation integral membrane protein YtvI [Aminipila butyrica]QIB70369.1 sporulation integral membrane protein YtvI [Aminipila butyrica]
MESQYTRKKSFIVNVVYIMLIALLVYISLKYVFNLISPFLFAFGIAYLLKTPAKKLSALTRIPVRWISIALVTLFYCTIGLLLVLLGVKLIATATDLVMQLPVLYKQQLEPFLLNGLHGLEKVVSDRAPVLVEKFNTDFDQLVNSLGSNVTNMSLSLIGAISNIASSLPAFFIKTLIMVISTFFIAADYDILSAFILKQFPVKGQKIIVSIKRYVIGTLFVVIRSYALIVTITFLELFAGLSIIGINNAVLIAMMVAVFDILPVLGTGGIMIPWTLISCLQGNYQVAVGLFILYLFITIVRNIIEPKIVGSQLGLHPIATLLCMFIGANLFGIIGLFGFPITLSLLRHLNDTGTIKIFK